MVLLSNAQWRSGLVVSLSGVLAQSGRCAVDEICVDERRVRRGQSVQLDSAAGGALNGLGTRSPVCIPIEHIRLEMRGDYFSMNSGIVQNERPTTRSYLSLQVARVGTPLGNGKDSVLVEPARLAKYITSIYVLTRSSP